MFVPPHFSKPWFIYVVVIAVTKAGRFVARSNKFLAWLFPATERTIF